MTILQFLSERNERNDKDLLLQQIKGKTPKTNNQFLKEQKERSDVDLLPLRCNGIAARTIIMIDVGWFVRRPVIIEL